MYLLRTGDYYNFPVEHETLNGVIYIETEEEVRKALKDHSDYFIHFIVNSLYIDWEKGIVKFKSAPTWDPEDEEEFEWKLSKLVKP